MTRNEAVRFLIERPAAFGRMLGFTKFTSLHNGWMREMILGKDDYTLQASRLTYKTSSVSVAIVVLMLTRPNARLLFLRKTDDAVKEIVNQVRKMLLDPHTQYFVNVIYGVNLRLTVNNSLELSTNLTTDVKGASQLVASGMKSSLVGMHKDYIFTDDIVNVEDRTSRAERERIKLLYQDLHNIVERDGKIFNSGTPWHPEDAFTLMPEPHKWDCYHPDVQKIIDKDKLAELKEILEPSLFACNYELRHIASENIIFGDPQLGASEELVKDSVMHIDAAYMGEDWTAWGVMSKRGEKYYLYGKCKRKHVDDVKDEIMRDYERLRCSKIYNEDNADKGYLAKELRALGARVVTYSETMNKHIKIVTYLKAIWKDLVFVDGTDKEYIEMICDYFEQAEHDDAPDDAACLARLFYKKPQQKENIRIWS